MMRKTFLTSALDMPEIMSYIYNKSWKLQFSASSSIIIIEDYYLQTFLHSLAFSKKVENDYYSATSKSIQVDRGYYYRVHASHIVCMAGSPDEETFSVTNGVLVP